MAWQLIYTSAPRLLEAGRSGFGTVARHRAISPLLVAAIERASQFARQPGLDAGRVIFCHRIISVAGGRFHVLSCIRDAGADYTGRTNHLAHHLIVEPREAAALGANGPSPADVLLAMPWRVSWAETPRYFEAEEEVQIESFTPQTGSDGAAWACVTGDANHAWLLAAGEASRGAYLFVPPRTDLRALFAESLRLAPERLWQVAFTTALQASDEPSDFRWIGLEADSPLRAQTESSGRPVLDLTKPAMLPVPDAPAVARTTSSPARTASPATSYVPAQRASPQASITRAPVAEAVAKRSSARWIAPAAVIVCAVVAIGAWPMMRNAREHRRAFDRLAQTLRQSEFFSTAPEEQFREELKSADAGTLAAAQRVTELANRFAFAVRDAKFGELKIEPANDPREIAQAAHFNLPAEIGGLVNAVQEIESEHAWVENFRPQPESYRELGALRERRRGLQMLGSKAPKPQQFVKVRQELIALAERKEAATVLAILNGHAAPAESLAWFRAAVQEGEKMQDQEARQLSKTAAQLVSDWEIADAPAASVAELEKRLSARRTIWPPWLLEKAQRKTPAARAGDTPPSTAMAPAKRTNTALYFALRSADLKELPIKELKTGLSFSLQSASGEVTKFAFNQNGVIRRNFNSQDDGFSIKGDRLEPEAHAPEGPFKILAHVANSAEELFIVQVGEPIDGKPLYGKDAATLVRKGDALEVKPVAATFVAQFAQPLWLDTPVGFDGSTAGSQVRPLQNWALDLQPVRDSLGAQAKAQEQLRQQAEEELRGFDKGGGQALEIEGTVKDLRLRRLFTGGADRLLDEALRAAPPLACDDLLKAIGTDWPANDFAKGDDIFNAAAPLRTARDGQVSAKAIRETLKNLDVIMEKANTREQKAAALPLLMVRRQVERLVPSGPDAEAERTRRRAQIEAKIETARRTIESLKTHPLTRQRVPPGLYRLLVEVPGGAKLPLTEIAVAAP
jgi:hypothetical protein